MGDRGNSYKAAIQAVLAEYGITKVRYEPTKKHMKCIFTLPDGRERFTIMPKTASDSARGALNQAQDVRRELRRCGVQPVSK